MSWLRKILHDTHESDSSRLLNLRCTRFRQLLRNYGKVLDRLADAAEKQSGEYVLDRQYIASLAEIVVDLAESIVFDLNVIAENRESAFYDVLSRLQNEIRIIVSAESAPESPSSNRNRGMPPASISPNRLAEAIGSAQVLFQHEGQVACRGVAAGVVFNLETAGIPAELPNGAVMVAARIRPDDELIRAMKKASAILADSGEPAGDVAILAREFRIPMIVGIRNASSCLNTGSTVTVDADENIVYGGRVQELLDYYDSERIPADEEPEYRLLRKLRRILFSLTLTENSEPVAHPTDCRSIHDLVHLASESASDALTELAVHCRELKTVYTEVVTGHAIPVQVIDVGNGLLQPADNGGRTDFGKVCSLPLLAFVSGLKEVDLSQAPDGTPDLSAACILAAIKEEHAHITVLQPRCHDIVDALIGESKESNHIYCRFAATTRDKDVSGMRGALTREILSRLNFAVAQTPRASSAWIAGLPLVEMKDRLTLLGRLSAFLMGLDAAEGETRASQKIVEEFMEQYA